MKFRQSAVVKETKGVYKSVDIFYFLLALTACILCLKANKMKRNVLLFHLEHPLFAVAWLQMHLFYTVQ